MGQEARVIETSPKHVKETGNSRMTYAAKSVYVEASESEDGIRFVQGHYENGISQIHAEKRLQVEAGAKNQAGDVDFFLTAHNGDITTSSPSGFTRVYADRIVLQAAAEIVIDAPTIRIGSTTIGGTREIKLIASDVKVQIGDNDPKSLGDVLKVSNIFKSISGPKSTIDPAAFLGVG
tara:strand:+ start:61 stop:594 length:534 start_codon:yes stop_codon:yes gene_type:complete